MSREKNSIVLIFAIKKTPSHVILGDPLEFFRTAEIGTPPDGCFGDYLGKQS